MVRQRTRCWGRCRWQRQVQRRTSCFFCFWDIRAVTHTHVNTRAATASTNCAIFDRMRMFPFPFRWKNISTEWWGSCVGECVIVSCSLFRLSLTISRNSIRQLRNGREWQSETKEILIDFNPEIRLLVDISAHQCSNDKRKCFRGGRWRMQSSGFWRQRPVCRCVRERAAN